MRIGASQGGFDKIKPMSQIPIVEYLSLGDQPYLVANECKSCGARFFDRRNACGKCGAREFQAAKVDSRGRLVAFSIVHRAAPSIQVPYVSGIVETDDSTTVRSNIIGVEADPEHIQLGMRVELDTYVIDKDDKGTECVAFGYTPEKA